MDTTTDIRKRKKNYINCLWTQPLTLEKERKTQLFKQKWNFTLMKAKITPGVIFSIDCNLLCVLDIVDLMFEIRKTKEQF